MAVTVESLRKLWKKEFILDVRKEISVEIEGLKSNMAALQKKLDDIEASHKFLSNKYDTVLQTIQETKKNLTLENQVKKLTDDVKKLSEENYILEVQQDESNQYSRRDTLEVAGIPAVVNDDPAKLIVEMADLMNIRLSEEDISVAHRLPPTKKTKDRLIVKFVRRSKRDEIYKKKGKLRMKRAKDLPTVGAQLEASSTNYTSQIHVNESLTPYRKKLFGRILDFKRSNNYKYLWTVNGKIMLRETDTSSTSSFTTFEQFEEYQDQIWQHSY